MLALHSGRQIRVHNAAAPKMHTTAALLWQAPWARASACCGTWHRCCTGITRWPVLHPAFSHKINVRVSSAGLPQRGGAALASTSPRSPGGHLSMQSGAETAASRLGRPCLHPAMLPSVVAGRGFAIVLARRGQAGEAPTASVGQPAVALTAANPRTHAALPGDAKLGQSGWLARRGSRHGCPMPIAKLMPASHTAARPLWRAQRSDPMRSRREAAGSPSPEDHITDERVTPAGAGVKPMRCT
jgi:hypothetical protein